jgi:hypothetical protein
LILNRVAECAATNKRLGSLAHLRYVVVHHTSLSKPGPDNPAPVPDDDLDGPALARIFRDNPKPRPDGLGTGGWCPYHILIGPLGRRELLMPLDAIGAHAPGYNRQSIAIAVIGDYNREKLSDPAMRALSRTCAEIVMINRGLTIGGHTTTFAASSDPGKVCPGSNISIPDLHRRVMERLPPHWRYRTAEEVEALLKLGGYLV